MQFKATPEQIETLHFLVIAKAFYKMAEQALIRFETTILAGRTFHYDESWYANQAHEDFDLPADRILVDREHLCYLRGLKALHTEAYEGTDAQRFFQALRTQALAAGYLNGEAAADIADSEILDLENKLIDLTYDSHQMPREDLDPDERKDLISIILDALWKEATVTPSALVYQFLSGRHTRPRVCDAGQ